VIAGVMSRGKRKVVWWYVNEGTRFLLVCCVGAVVPMKAIVVQISFQTHYLPIVSHNPSSCSTLNLLNVISQVLLIGSQIIAAYSRIGLK